MSALDDLIARDMQATAQPSGGSSPLDALIARDMASGNSQRPQLPPPRSAQPVQGGGLFDGSIGSQISDAASAFGHHVMNLPHGIAQLVENGIDYGAQQLPSNPVSSYIHRTVQADNQAMAQREQNYQANTPDSAGAYLGATAGEVAPFVFNTVAAPLRAAGDYVGNLAAKQVPKIVAKTTGRVASGATQGALVGATQPVTNPSDYWNAKAGQVQTGAITGGAIPAVAGAASGTYRALKDAAQPLLNPDLVAAKKLSATTGLGADDLTRLLSDPAQLVPGSMPTTAQVIATPEAVQLEKAIGNNPAFKPKFEESNIANNAARLGAIQKIAGTPEQMDAAIAARDAATKPLYQKAFDSTLDVSNDPVFRSLADTPAMRDAINTAQSIAKNNRESVFNPDGQLTGRGAHYIKMALDDAQQGSFQNAIGRAEQGSIGNLQGDYLKWLESRIPEYGQARSAYADLSRPINTMETGNNLLDTLSNKALNPSGDPAITFAAYTSQLSKALKNAQYGIDPEAKATLEAIQKDLQRSTISNSIRSPGSDTNYNTQAQGWLSRQLYGNDFAGGGAGTKIAGTLAGAVLGSLFGHPYGGAAAGATAATKLSSIANKRVNEAMAKLMLSPQDAAQSMSLLTPPARNSGLLTFLNENPITQQLLHPQNYPNPYAR